MPSIEAAVDLVKAEMLDRLPDGTRTLESPWVLVRDRLGVLVSEIDRDASPDLVLHDLGRGDPAPDIAAVLASPTPNPHWILIRLRTRGPDDSGIWRAENGLRGPWVRQV